MEQVAGDKVMTEAASAPAPSGENGGVDASSSTGVPPPSKPRSGQLSAAAVTAVLQYWKAFDLDSKRVMLDTQGSTMKTEKDSSLRSRKKLAETTKSFRRLTGADKTAEIGSLLRSYQEEIDNLTRRAKYAENAFFMLYKGLYAAPDPVPCLEGMQSLPSTDKYERENRKLKEELRAYEVEFASLKNQEITIRTLEDQVATLEHAQDDTVQQKVTEKCKQLEDQLTATTLEFAQKRVDYERQLDHGRTELREALSRLDAVQSELFSYKQRAGVAQSTLNAEMDLISQEQVMMQMLRLENAQLKKQIDEMLDPTAAITAAQSNGGTTASAASLDAAPELARQEVLISNQHHEIARLHEALTNARQEQDVIRAGYEIKLSEAQRVQEHLTAELAERPTPEKYREVTHQLRILQQLEYNIVDEEKESSSGGGSSETDAHQATSEIEKILVSRVRRLEHSLQQRDLTLQHRASELEQVQGELQRKSDAIEQQAALIRTLEESVASLQKRRAPNGALTADAGAEILMDAVEEAPTPLSSGDSRMFEIVRGQRDRFRERMKELQAERNAMEERTNASAAQVARLEHDNMELYQRIRYLQSYQSHTPTPSRNNPRSVLPDLAISIPNDGGFGSTSRPTEVERRYQGMYEQRMNPFQQFNKLETQQRYQNLNAVDKILLTSARLLLGHRLTRDLAFGYILVLHFLVFATLYTFMHRCAISNA